MAKKGFDLGATDPLSFADETDSPQRGPSSTRSRRDVRKVSKVGKRSKDTDAKGRFLKTICLPSETMDEVEDIIKKHGYSVMDFYHWLIEMGLDDFRRGERPEVADTAVKKTINI